VTVNQAIALFDDLEVEKRAAIVFMPAPSSTGQDAKHVPRGYSGATSVPPTPLRPDVVERLGKRPLMAHARQHGGCTAAAVFESVAPDVRAERPPVPSR